MAPSPEYDKEPKAPDKNASSSNSEESRPSQVQTSDHHRNLDSKPGTAASQSDIEENKHLGTLDDGQLRALLDEAITYKRPKDREGKSNLFKELLAAAEVEQEVEEPCEVVCGRRGARGRRGRRELPHSGSLQDLVAALAEPPLAPRRRHAPVSARAHHGGSLPSGVDRSFLMSEEPMRSGGADYIATVRCVNPPPLNERRVSASDAHQPQEMELLRRNKMPGIPVTYTSRATLDIGSFSVYSGRAHTTTTSSSQGINEKAIEKVGKRDGEVKVNLQYVRPSFIIEGEDHFDNIKEINENSVDKVDSGMSFGCITTPVVASCNTTPSTPQTSVSVDPKPRSVIASNVNGLASMSRTSYGATTSAQPDEYKKSLDENGNALQNFNSSSASGSSQHKKPRRKKSSKNETEVNVKEIDGYQGNKEIDELMKFIESNPENGRGHKLTRVTKHKEEGDDKGKKRSTERRSKDKESKLKRANSMEELSRTKLEDLTDKPEVPGDGTVLRKVKKERSVDGQTAQSARKSERRSWGDESRDTYFYSGGEESTSTSVSAPIREKKKVKQSKSTDTYMTPSAHEPVETVEMLEFQTVTKKKKPRKRFDDGEREHGAGGDIGYRKQRQMSPDRRRKSAPPSDKSNDSNDDLDSVHSLPAESSNDRCPDRGNTRPASTNCTPQASYADIARTRHNIPDLIESCNFYPGVESPPELEDKAPRKKEIIYHIEQPPPAPEPIKPQAVPAESTGPAYDAENYPALDARSHRSIQRAKEPKTSPPKKSDRKTKPPPESNEEKSVTPKSVRSEVEIDEKTTVVTAPPDVVLAPDRRPAVILLDEATRPRDMDGITFGFDINEQLLNGEVSVSAKDGEEVECDLVLCAGAAVATAEVPGVSVRVSGTPLRYLPPAPLDTLRHQHLDKIVHYVGTAWEDIIKCGSGKVRYYTE